MSAYVKFVVMYDNDVFVVAKSTLENCSGLGQVFAVLPENVEISLVVDSRIHCTLVSRNSRVVLEPRKSLLADLEVTINPESIRRLKDQCPDSLVEFSKLFTEQLIMQNSQIRILSSLKMLHEKGYVAALKKLGPELQKDLSKYAFLLFGQVSQIVETIKTMMKR